MNTLNLKPIKKIDGEINLPGSKSFSNRALLLAALAQGDTLIKNLLVSEDTQHMLTALERLGVSLNFDKEKRECLVEGLGEPFRTEKSLKLFLGNAGTAMRPLCAALCLGEGEFVLEGEPRMEERPIGDLVDALRMAGASIEYLKNENYPPVKILAKGLKGGVLSIDGSVSSQFLSALLMAAPLADRDIEINIKGELVSKPYIEVTLSAMKAFGVVVAHNNYQTFLVKGKQSYQSPNSYYVEGDASSASYFLAAAAIKGGTVKVNGIGKNSIQGDRLFAQVLEDMGANVTWGDRFIEVSKGALHAIDQDLNHIPDAAMTIATTALFAEGKTAIRNIYNWRVKETDRISAMVAELRKVGAEVVEGEDFLEIIPPKKIKHAHIDTYNDHRIAMCFSLLALDESSVSINDPECTAKTFPDYFGQLANISHY